MAAKSRPQKLSPPTGTAHDEHQQKGRVAPCPICSAPSDPEYRPFCSRRCADVDLSRWLRGGYAIPGRLDVDEDGDDVAAADGQIRNRLDRPDEDSSER